MVDPYYVQGMADDGYGDDDAQWDSPSHIEPDTAIEGYERNTATERQREVLHRLAQRGSTGATWVELSQLTGWHHGQSSGCLSVLHKEGRVARLTEVRHRCSVYVLTMHVEGRDTLAPRSAKTALAERQVETLRRILGQADERGLDAIPVDILRKIMEAKR